MSLTNIGLLLERPHPYGVDQAPDYLDRAKWTGVQRIYRWGWGGVSMINAPCFHAYPFRWEAAVLYFEPGPGDHQVISYETPLSSDVEVFMSDREANRFLARARRYFLSTPRPAP